MNEALYAVSLGAVSLTLLYSINSYNKAKKRQEKLKRNRQTDMNVEFNGPGVSLKRKHYPTEVEDDFRQKIIEQKEDYND